MKKAVYLDRDGTIIRDMIYLNDPKKIEVFTESYKAIQLLNEAGYIVVLVTNQSGVARGIVQIDNLKEINRLIVEDFKNHGALIQDVYFCPDAVDSNSPNRKPNPGMLLMAAEKYNIALNHSWMVGDRMTDVEAGRRAGCKSILLKNKTTPPIDTAYKAADYVASDMLDAANIILNPHRSA